MRVLVTGSHGFIGKNLVNALKERGDEVISCDVKPGADIFHIGHYTELADRRFDEIFHLACVNQEEAVRFPARNIEVNAGLTRLVAQIAKNQNARLVYTSTASVYGNQTKQPIGVLRSLAPKSDYAVAKLAGEWFVRNSGADFTIFRLSNVYGPYQTTENPYCGVVGKFLEAAIAGKPLQIIGDGSQTRDFTFVGDVVTHLLDPSLKGLLNCSHGKETSVFQLAYEVEAIVGTHPPSEYIPERPIDGIQRRCLRSSVICPTSLELGLSKTVKWFRDH